MSNLWTPEQHADLLISEVGKAEHAKTGNFSDIAKHREAVIEQFRLAVSQAIEQACLTATMAKAKGEEDIAAHIAKHFPD